MMNNMVRTLGIVVLVALGVDCGGGGSTTLTQSAFCSQKAEKECTGVAARCLAPAAACQTARIAACNAFAAAQQQMPSAVARPFRPDKASACLSKAAEVYSKPSAITPTDRDALDKLCARVFSGKKKDSDPDPSCTNDYECDASQICDVSFGTCAPKTVAAANANCNNPGQGCPMGQFCAGPTPRKCMPRMTMGQACTDTSPCVENLRCANGFCAERLDLSAACTTDDDCLPAAPYCDSFNGSVCDTGFIPSPRSPECIGAFGAGP